jgi:hypothetical protein
LKNDFLKLLKGDFYQCGHASECNILHLEEFEKLLSRREKFVRVFGQFLDFLKIVEKCFFKTAQR